MIGQNSEYLRSRAEADRVAAAIETLPMPRARLLASAERYEALADRQASLESSTNYRKKQDEDRLRNRPQEKATAALKSA